MQSGGSSSDRRYKVPSPPSSPSISPALPSSSSTANVTSKPSKTRLKPVASSSRARTEPSSGRASPKRRKQAGKALVKPDYTDWSLGELQAETGKYGFKPPSSVAACRKILNQVWIALAPPPSRPASRARSSRSKSASEQSEPSELDTDIESDTSASSNSSSAKPLRTKKVPRVSAASMISAGEFLEDDEATAAEGKADVVEGFAEQMRRLVLADSELYGKILRYQVRPPQ